MTNVSDRVKGIIAKHLGVDRDKVTEDDNFIDDLGADSLDTIELAMSFEDAIWLQDSGGGRCRKCGSQSVLATRKPPQQRVAAPMPITKR